MSSINAKNKEDEEKLESIFSYLSSDEHSTKNIAIHSYLKMLEKGRVPQKYQKKMISFIQGEIQDKESPIHTELYETLSKSSFTTKNAITSMVPLLKKEFQTGNQFHIKWILKFIASTSHTLIPSIDELMTYILEESKEIFDTYDLKVLLCEFLRDIVSKNPKLLELYKNDIINVLNGNNADLNEEFKDIKKEIQSREDFLKQERNRRAKQKELRKKYKKKLAENQQKVEKKRNPIEKTSEKTESSNQRSNEEPPIKENQENNEKNQGIDNKKGKDNSTFVSFSSLGLKRKNQP